MTKAQRFSVINLNLPIGANVNPGDLDQPGGRAACAWCYAYHIAEEGGGGETPSTSKRGEYKRRRWLILGV